MAAETEGIERLGRPSDSTGLAVALPRWKRRHRGAILEMSREIGGRADKDGNEFERLWVVEQALRVLQGEATSLQWEPPGKAGFGMELEVTDPDGDREVHQCKIENGLKGSWSAADLNSVGVLKAAQRHLQRPSVTKFVFVSRDPAVSALRDLVERAQRTNDDPELFYQTALSSKEHQHELQQICKAWDLDHDQAADRARAFSLLQSLRFEIGIWDASHRGRLEFAAGLLAEGKGREIVDSLGSSLSQNLGQETYADHIRVYLREAGHPPRDLRSDPRVPARIERLRQSFEDSLKGLLLGGHLMPRAETQELLALLDASDGPRIVFLHGPAGIGKSDVELELARTFAERGTPFLPIRLDFQPPRGSLSTYSSDVLELPSDPAYCLAALAGKRPAVLLIDQLDALRWTGGHSAEALRIVKEILNAALAVETIRVVLACRTFDLENDFKTWKQEYADRSQLIEVKPLGDDQVRSFVEGQGARYGDLSLSQRDLLRNPYTLFLWWELYREHGEFPHFVNKTGLLSEYRRQIARRLSRMGQPDAIDLLEDLVEYLDRHGRFDAPSSLVGSRIEAREALQSLNVLREPRHRFLTFAHQRLLDFLVAEQVAREAMAQGTSPVEWLRRNDQSLFRRDQLRQLLTLLRDQEPSLYITTLEEILTAENIRFHLQHLALGILREPASPSEDELNLVKRLLNVEEWRPHVFDQVILGSRPWFEKLDDAGLFANWLASNDERLIEKALLACRSVASQAADRIERLLGPYWATGEEAWRAKIDSVLGYKVNQLTERMTDWLLARVRDGSRRIDWLHLGNLADQHPTRAVRLFEAHLLSMLDQVETSERLSFDRRDRTRGALDKACRSAPDEAWSRLLPILLRSIRTLRRMRPAPGECFFLPLDPRSSRRRHQKKINYQVRRLLSEAGAELARREGLAVLDRIAPLFAIRSKCVQRLMLNLFLKGPDNLADFALQWLYAAPMRLQLGSLNDASQFEPARRLIERFASLSSAEVYEELEARLMMFHPRSEMRAIRNLHEEFSPKGRLIPSRYGRAQHILLSALPQSRMSNSAQSRLEAWHKKFGRPLTGRRLRGKGGVVRSSIPRDKIQLVSDKQWLSIVTADWTKRQKSAWARDFLLEVSHEEFAQYFGLAARLQPERFLRLTLRMPACVPSVYFIALFNALRDKPPTSDEGAPASWRPAPVEKIEEVLWHIQGSLKDRNIAWAVCRLVQARHTDSWSNWVFELLLDYVESQPGTFGAEDGEQNTDISIAVEESVRGTAAEALMSMLLEKRELTEAILPAIEKLVIDHNPAMRAAAQGLCLPLLSINPERAVRLFLQSCDHPDDRVMAGPYTNRFLRYTWDRYPDLLEPLLERMIESDSEKTAEMGAFWVTAGQIGEGLYGDLAARCVIGSEAHRKGTAEAMAQLLQRPEPESKQAALRGLLDLLHSSDKAADSKVADLLREEEILESPEGPVLAEAYIRSSAMDDDPGDLFYGLQHFSGSLVPYAHILFAAVQRLGGDLAPATRDLSTKLSGAVSSLPELLLRLYEEAEDPHLRSVRKACLDAWDSLLRNRVGWSWDVLHRLDA